MKLSIEVLVSQVDNFINAYADSAFNTQQKALKVLVPHINGKPYSTVIKACEKLIEAGFEVIPHCAVRNLTAEDDMQSINQFFTTHTQSVLLLGGDNDKPTRFHSVIDFLNSEWEKSNIPVQNIYFSIFPEGHPHVDEATGHKALEEKIKWANTHHIPCGSFSQICLDAQPIIDYNARLSHYDFEFYNSFVAPCKISQLIKLAAISGVKNAISFLKKHNMLKMLSKYDSDELIAQVHQAPTKAHGLHCYAFGNYSGALEKLSKYHAQNNS